MFTLQECVIGMVGVEIMDFLGGVVCVVGEVGVVKIGEGVVWGLGFG
jgi:hypothetical protein